MFKKLLHMIHSRWDIVSYLFFGVLTTVINYAVYFPLYNYFSLSAIISNAFAWIAAVIFAFITNKIFVFKSSDWSAKTLFSELVKFLGCRVGSGLMESIALLVLVDMLNCNGNIIKILTGILVIIVNYVGSKLFVFKNK